MTEKDLIIQDLRRENVELRAKLAKDTNVHTNADRIRAMTDAQLAKMLTIGRGGFHCSECVETGDCEQNCEGNCLKWLQQPAEEG